MAQVVKTDVLQPVLGQQPIKVLRHEIRADQLAFLIGADEIQILSAVALLEQLAVKLLPFLLLQKFFFTAGINGRVRQLVLFFITSLTTGTYLPFTNCSVTLWLMVMDFRSKSIDGHFSKHLAAAQTVVGCNEDAQVQGVILRYFQQLLDFILGVEVGPEAVLLRAVNFQHRVGFQIVLADGILERFTEDGVVVNDRVSGVASSKIFS